MNTNIPVLYLTPFEAPQRRDICAALTDWGHSTTVRCNWLHSLTNEHQSERYGIVVVEIAPNEHEVLVRAQQVVKKMTWARVIVLTPEQCLTEQGPSFDGWDATGCLLFPSTISLAYLRANIATLVAKRKTLEIAHDCGEHLEANEPCPFDYAGGGIFHTDANGIIISASASLAQILGYQQREMLIGSSLLDLFVEPVNLATAFQTQKVMTIAWKKHTGETITVELRGHPSHSPSQNHAGYTGLVRDVTHYTNLAKQQDELNEHNIILKHIIEGTRLGFWDWNPQTDTVRFNERWAEMLGFSLPELSSAFTEWSSRVHPDDIATCYEDIRRHLEGTTAYYENVHRMKHKDGHWVHILGHGKIVAYDNQGRPTRFCGTNTDITKEKEGEQLALEANRSKTHFLASMSHELRTPLNAVLGLSEALLDKTYGGLTEKQEKSLRTIYTSGRHLLALINDVLDIARIEAGKLSIDPRPVVWSQLSSECVALVQELAHTKDQNIVLESESSLQMVYADPRRLRQVLINLLSNAIKFCPERATISLGGRINPANREVEIWVSDNGPGIAPSQQHRIFEPFFTLDSSLSREQGGAGLGLALVKRFIELHHGTITLESDAGKGAKFVVSLPSNTPDQFLRQRSQQFPVVRAPLEATQKILLVEDNEANVFTTAKYLESKGYQLTIARDGVAGVVAANDPSIALIIMDVELPRMDGLTAIQRIRSEEKQPRPIIVLTAHAMPGDEERVLSAGATAYLSKPVQLKELVLKIKELLR